MYWFLRELNYFISKSKLLLSWRVFKNTYQLFFHFSIYVSKCELLQSNFSFVNLLFIWLLTISLWASKEPAYKPSKCCFSCCYLHLMNSNVIQSLRNIAKDFVVKKHIFKVSFNTFEKGLRAYSQEFWAIYENFSFRALFSHTHSHTDHSSICASELFLLSYQSLVTDKNNNFSKKRFKVQNLFLIFCLFYWVFKNFFVNIIHNIHNTNRKEFKRIKEFVEEIQKWISNKIRSKGKVLCF